MSAVSSAQIHGGQFIFGRAWDPDGDGAKSLLAASGAVHSFALPLVGAVTPWDDATDGPCAGYEPTSEILQDTARS